MRLLVSILLVASAGAFAQQPVEPVEPQAEPVLKPAVARTGSLTVPAGTKVIVALKHPITTKTARPGDAVYAQTTFPVAVNDQLLIPPGTYVQGVIGEVRRPGRVKGRAEVLFHFNRLIFPNGYTVALPGAIDNVPGAERQRVKDQEGTLQQAGDKGKDAATVAKVGAAGAAVGAGASGTAKGAAIGGGLGAAAGLAATLLTRGSDLRIESGTTVEMVLQRPLVLDEARMQRR